MIKTISVIDKDKEHYLYESEKTVLLKMLNNKVNSLDLLRKRYVIISKINNIATVRIYSITNKFFFLKNYILKTTLKIKYN